MKERLTLFDTTLRDGQQTQGVDFTAAQKRAIAEALDGLGIDYIEGGWPGANPTDTEFFAHPPALKRAQLLAFGMTKRVGRSASNDETLAMVLGANTPAICLVGKSHDYHVEKALGATLAQNIENISESFRHLCAQGRETMFDAEHFFDGYKANPDYALDCVGAAFEAGASWVILCDTNGGALPAEVSDITKAVCARFPGGRIGIHTHNDTENAVANSLAAVLAGARQIQGTLNGLGERCGNANLVSIIPTLMLKEPFKSRFEIGVSESGLADLTRISRLLDDILNRAPDISRPYVGAAAFAHKAGLHASAIAKDPATYEHIAPEIVGNQRVVPMSNQAGRANLLSRLRQSGLTVAAEDPRLPLLLGQVKEKEDRGFAYDSAAASFEILARRALGQMPDFFEVERYSVSSVRRYNVNGEVVTASEAVVKVVIDGERLLSVSESADPITGADQGPVNALSRALFRDLGKYQDYIKDMELEDYKVRIVGGGTEAVTRVLIDFHDGARRWSTVGVSANIVDASFQALEEAILYKLIMDGAPASARMAAE